MEKLKFRRIFTYLGWTGYYFFSKDKEGQLSYKQVRDEGDFIGYPNTFDVHANKSSTDLIDLYNGDSFYSSILIQNIKYCRLPSNKEIKKLQPFVDAW